MNLRGQDILRVIVSILGIGVLVVNRKAIWLEEPDANVWYYSMVFLAHVAVVGFTAGTVWELIKRWR
jgi:hypothetical protein